MRISVVIPALNERELLAATIASARAGGSAEVIVVDAGSTDGTGGEAERAGALVLGPASGRARQMNLGAAAAGGEVILFLHADTALPEGWAAGVEEAAAAADFAAGAFRLGIDGPERTLRMIESMANARARWLGLPYGDQALFLRAETFRRLGGFREMPIMEDVELVRRLRRLGRIVIVPLTVRTSARRWRRLGPWRASLMNQLALAAWLAGVPAARVADWYGRPRRPR